MLSKKFLIYVLRWLASAFVMMPFLFLVNEYITTNQYVALCLVQIIGAFIFWNIDRAIFKDKK